MGRGGIALSVALAAVVLLAGCATSATQKWNSSVGSYTVGQALKELGPPQRATICKDGTQCGEWLVRLGTRSSIAYHYGTIFDARVFDYTMLPRDPPMVPDEFLRLLFAPDGKLITWDRYYR